MGGSTKKYDTTPSDIGGLRGGMVNYLMGQPGQNAAAQTNNGWSPGTGQSQPGFPGGPQIMPFHGGMMPGGPQPQSPQPQGGSPFDRIMQGDPGQVGRTQLGPIDQISPGMRSRDVNSMPVSFDPTSISMMNPHSMPQVGASMNSLEGMNRGQIGNVTPGALNGQSTQSVDQLGGDKSAFFNNMMNHLQPAFTQQRDLALAQAKEGAGSLTGSGFANALGNTMNRSLGDEQARLADYASQGLQTEVGRQTALAGINSGSDIARFQGGINAQGMNQNADTTFMQHMLQRGQLGQQGEMANQDIAARLGIANQGAQTDAARLGLQAGQSNQDAALRAGMANQGADATFNAAEMQRQGMNQNANLQGTMAQGQMDQQRMMQEFMTRAQRGDANAQRFLQMLMGMGTTGVGPSEIVHSQGIGQQLLGGALGIAGSMAGAGAFGGRGGGH